MTGIRLAGFVAALALSGSVAAAPITWEFEGIVRYSDLPGSLAMGVGAMASGRVIYESTAAPPDGAYEGAVSAFEVRIGDYQTGSIIENGFNALYMLHNSYNQDLLLLESFIQPDETFPTALAVSLALRADAPSVMSGWTMPTAPPALWLG